MQTNDISRTNGYSKATEYLSSLLRHLVDTLVYICAMLKALKVISFILWLIRSFLSIWINLGFHLFYGNQKFKLPPITNQILLQPATVIAKRIRQRQVTNFKKRIKILFLFV
jgi:fatty acid amide hydrolase 2